ncbi:DUF1707 domain-containing protein [Solirubrobacter ginsenosidimutans]|uniref:DUF1707 domain-containing protein n=1 Tax=Solirubrobacter ginsenosidimutans TaxID=490573 RepID=A0A9X3N275_9ACTN|nr:DUF1707 domain-containing protein [Solirubrobacter ginsenosidimutans]MDA0166917.1 DUF1707 domain-containing protein [Solirubrobacter ginsenosidimutans]
MTLAGDADRSKAIVTLRDATVEGRLTLDEFADRVERAELARTFADLESVTADLPSTGAADLPVKHGAWFSRLQRSGRWELAPASKVLSVCGTIELDLGRATLHGAETVMRVRNVFGTITILVPRGVEVSVDGSDAFGTREIDLPDTGPVGDAPRLRILTSGVGGTLRVKTSGERPGAGE